MQYLRILNSLWKKLEDPKEQMNEEELTDTKSLSLDGGKRTVYLRGSNKVSGLKFLEGLYDRHLKKTWE